MSDREFDNINGIKVCDQTARDKIPTKTSQLENDSDYATITQVNQAIDNAQLGGGDVDLSGYVTKETGNANQITFADGQTFQAKLDAGILKGERGEQGIQGEQGPQGDKGDTGAQGPAGDKGADGLTTSISVNGATYTHVNGVITLPNYPSSTGGTTDYTQVWKGKKATFYGDSLTEVNFHYTKGYHKWIQEILELTSYENYGVSGYKIADVYNKVNNTTATGDIIFVMCGVNDENFSTPLGTMEDDTTTTIYGAYDKLCSLLKTKYPTKIILFITPHYQTRYPHNEGITSYEVSKAMKEVCEKYAINVYDNYAICGIYPQNTTNKNTFTKDGCHWNDLGHEIVGKNLANYVLNTYRYVYTGSTTENPVSKPCTNIVLNNTSLSFTDATTQTLIATLTPTDTTDQVTWSVSPSGICTVNNGVVSPVANGNCTITASCGDKTATCTVEVALTQVTEESRKITMDSYNNSNVFNLTALVENPKTQLSSVKIRLKASDLVNCQLKQASAVSMFGDNSGEVNNSSFSGSAANPTCNVNNSGYFEYIWQPNNTFNTQYLKIPVPITVTDTSTECSLIIDDLQVLINDTKVPILKLGGFFKDKETVTGNIEYILSYVNAL